MVSDKHNSSLATYNLQLATVLSSIGYFETAPTLAVAVSGGADSMALLLLANAWAKANNGKVIALTVDHGLRPEAAAETAQVGEWCQARDIEHHILRAQDSGFQIKSRIQETAREARYQLLTQWCKTHGVLHLLTAHHRDDQAETLFFRLSRGSFIDGLASMPMVSIVNGVRLLRPLLAIPKTTLEELLKESGQPWINDPSNYNPRYTRNHIRARLIQMPSFQSVSQKASKLTFSFGAIRNYLENQLASQLTHIVSLFPEGYAILNYHAFLQLPPELGLRALSAIAITLNGNEHPPRSEKVKRLYDELQTLSLKSTRFKRSFAGLLFMYQAKTKRLLICREPSAIAAPMEMPMNGKLLWDNRFSLSVDAGGHALRVQALGAAGVKLLHKNRPKWLAKPVFATLPSLWCLEELVAVPHINYTNPHYRNVQCAARFMPRKPLAAPAFSAMTI